MPDSSNKLLGELVTSGFNNLSIKLEKLQEKLQADIQSLSSQISEIKMELKRVEGEVDAAQRTGNDAKEEIAKIERELRELEKRADNIRRDQDVLRSQTREDVPERMAVIEEIIKSQKWLNRALISGVIGMMIKVFFDLMKTV